MRRLILALTATLLALAACGKSIDTAEWTEEVRLSDGRMVVVWRKARAYSGGFPNARRGRNVDLEFKYEPLGVYWKGVISPTLVREPVSFDVIDGSPFLVLYIIDREGCRQRPGNDFSAQFLKWADGQWVDVPQAQFPVDRALMNLSGDYWGHTAKDDYKGLIRWGQKALRGGASQASPDTIKSYFERGARTCADNLKN